MDLDLRALRYATALARRRSFTRAAEDLGVSQPTLSRTIHGLEQSLGLRLFDRGRQGAEPTQLGQFLVDRAHIILGEVDQLQNELHQALDLGLGRAAVVAGSVASAVSVGRACAQLIARHPGLKLRMSTTSDVRGAVRKVLERQADLAVVEVSEHQDDPRLEIESLPRHRGAFLCRANHPLDGLEAPTLAEIARFPLASPRLAPRMARLPAGPLISGGSLDTETGGYLPALTVDTYDLAKRAAETSDAVTLAPLVDCEAELEDGRLVVVPFFEPWMESNYGFVTRRGRTLSPASSALMAEVRAVEAELEEIERRLNRSHGPAPSCSEEPEAG